MQKTLHSRLSGRAGFTLVELMMVIAIIAVLVGLTLTGVNAARRAIKRQSIALEVSSLAQAVEAYKLKYGEYPPDGSNKAAFESHYRSAFPNILSDEFDRLYSSANSNGLFGSIGLPSAQRASVMDPAEALVFALGGFSNDATRPFTGPGGPLSASGSGFQYNPERNKGFFEFEQDRLTLTISGNATVSNDEDSEVLGTLLPNDQPIAQVDALPVYSPRSSKAPYVYFAGPTYSFQIGAVTYYNHYKAGNVPGVARPYKSEQRNTNVQLQPWSYANAERHYRYVNDKSFQIVSAGMDDDYGGVRELVGSSQTPVFFKFPSGSTLNIETGNSVVAGDKGYINPSGGPSAQIDNVTNFSEGTLESTLP